MSRVRSSRRHLCLSPALIWVVAAFGCLAERALAQSLLGPPPWDYTRLVGQANERAKANDTVAALAAFEQAIKLYPYGVDAYVARAAIEEKMQNHRAVVDDLSRAIERGAGTVDVYHRRAIAYDHLDEYERELADLNWALAIDPSQTDLLFLRGQVRDITGDHRGGIDDLTRCLLAPTFESRRDQTAVLRLRGRARQAGGDEVGAIIDFSRAIELDPANAEAFLGRGKAKATLEMYQASLADFTHAIGIDPNLYDAYLNRGIAARDLGDYPAALADCAAAIKLNPKWDAGYINTADLENALGKFDAAYASACQAVELHGYNLANANIVRGMAEYYRGDFVAAKASFAGAATAGTSNGAAWVFQAVMAEIDGDFARAAADCDEAIRRDAATDAYVFRAIALWRAGRQAPPQSLSPVVMDRLGGWTRTVARFLVGEINEKQFAAAAEKGERAASGSYRCERFYYSAIVKLVAGDTAAAKSLLTACLETKHYDRPCYMLACAELKRL